MNTVDKVKAAGDYFAAGVLSAHYGESNNYGCHFGMRSTYQYARNEFAAGFNSYKGL